MSVIKFLSQLRKLKINIWVEDNTLRYKDPEGAMTSELLAEFTEKQKDIISFLNQVNSDTRSVQEPVASQPRDAGGLPVSYSQESLWFFDQLFPDSPVYNIPNAIRIRGDLNRNALKMALDGLVKRHEPLRTVFKSVNSRPVQEIVAPEPVFLEERDLTASSQAECFKELQRIVSEEAWRPFNLETGPLWRVLLITLAPGDFVLMFTIHHIISDAWSNQVFVSEFFSLYQGYCTGNPPFLPDLTTQFADYASWQRQRLQKKEVLEPLLTYWKKQLANPTILELPTDHPRPAVQSFSGRSEHISLPAELSETVKQFCLKHDVTMFMFLMAVFQTLLFRYSSHEDIIAGSVVANRNRPEITGLIGFFMNTIVLRTNFANEPTFLEVLEQVRKMTLDAYTHQDLPFDKLLEEIQPERDLSRTPLFQVMLILQNTGEAQLRTPGLTIEEIEIENKVAPFDLRFVLHESPLGIKGHLDYCNALFEPATIRRMLEHFQILLESILDGPDRKVTQLTILSAQEQKRVLTDFNDTAVPYPKDQTIYELFESQVEQRPEATAVIFEKQTVSYAELNRRSNQLAHDLKSYGVGPDVMVGICIERSVEMVVGILGILKAGGAYVPLDPNYPKERLSFMLSDAGTPLLLTQEQLLEKVSEYQADTICLDRDWPRIAGQSSQNLPREVTDANLAYVIYTSGSTGAPKGALNTHLGIRNHKLWMQDRYRLTPADRVLQKTPFSFDVSVWEFFWPLITGACLVVAKPEGHKDPDYLVQTIIAQNITVIHFVPSMLSIFLEHPDAGKCTSLRQVFCSGEALTMDLQKRFFSRLQVPLHNVYGPAESADVVAAWTCTNDYDDGNVPIGKPISNIQIYILDKYLNPVPIGIPGELAVSGAGLGRGYHNNPKLTGEKFIPNPWGGPGARMYKTGDLARFRPDGNIEYMGRVDFQVKIRGFRIELGEIEKILAGFDGIKESVIIAWEKTPGDKHLVAYVVAEKGAALASDEIQAYLGKSLPEYMVPRIYVFLSELPLSPNGKVDRKALPAPTLTQKENIVAPRTPVETTIVKIWEEVLGISPIGIYDDFFDLGGHSLLATTLSTQLNKAFQKNISLQQIFRCSTVVQLAGLITGQTAVSSNEVAHDDLEYEEGVI
jgi:amino acid adenylation domain-containing protein